MTSSQPLVKPQFKETATIRLTAPLIHIGSELQQLNPFEFIATSDRIYFPNQETLGQLLVQRGLLDDYVETIKARQSLVPLLQKAFGDQWLSVKDGAGNPLFPNAIASRNWTDQPIEQLRPMIRNKYSQPYIPGSSIKGAIRTAIAYHFLKYPNRCGVPEAQRVSAIEAQLRQSMGNLKRERGQIGDRLFMKDLFSQNHLTYQSHSPEARQGPNTDFMRAIQVSDTPPIHRREVQKKGQTFIYNQAIVAEVMVISHFPNKKAKHRASIFAECLFNTQTSFHLTLDTEMLSWFKNRAGLKIPFSNITELLNICQDFAQDQWDADYNYWQEIQNNRDQGRSLNFDFVRQRYDKEDCPYGLRLGWASGMNGTTVGLQLPEDLRQEIRDQSGIKAPGFQAPKTRRIAVNANGDLSYPPGWATLKRQD